MKLLAALVTAGLALTGATASAQPGPPADDLGLGLDVDVDVDVDADLRPPPTPAPQAHRRDPARAKAFRQMMIRRFDRDHDGRLDAREKHAARRFLRQRARQHRREQRQRLRAMP